MNEHSMTELVLTFAHSKIQNNKNNTMQIFSRYDDGELINKLLRIFYAKNGFVFKHLNWSNIYVNSISSSNKLKCKDR